MTDHLLLPDIRIMLAETDDAGLAAVMSELHPATIADCCEGLSIEEIWQLFEHTSIEKQAHVFPFLPRAKQVQMVRGTGQEHMSRLIEKMPHDERVRLLKSLSHDVVDSLLPLVAKADRQDIRMLLSYPENSAGSVMTTDYSWLPPDIRVSDAFANLRQQAHHSETIYYTYVLDPERHLVGFVSLYDLILAPPTAQVSEIMQRELISVRVDQNKEEVARKMQKFDFLAMPVVDAENRLVGIVTHDDMIDVVVQEATDDALKMGGVGSMAENYMKVPLVTMWRNRAGWLSCLFVAELFTFTALAQFEHDMEEIVALSLFIPLCLSTGGNSGAQAATLITRAMALGYVRISDWWRVLRHELILGLMLGVTLGILGFFRASLTPQSVLGNANRWMLALVIAQAVTLICIWGTLVGSMLPLIFRRLGFDPAYASSPFVATFVDVTGIVIYFSIASVFLL